MKRRIVWLVVMILATVLTACETETNLPSLDFSLDAGNVGFDAAAVDAAVAIDAEAPDASPPNACPPSTWDDDADPATPCVAWTVCGEGTYVIEAPSATSDRKCAACTTGTFTSTGNAPSCQAWTECAAGTFVKTAGSAQNDRACEACAPGEFAPSPNLSKCLPANACPAGTEETKPATSTKPAECTACPIGTFCEGGKAPKVACPAGTWDHDSSSATACGAWTNCAVGSFVAASGSTTTDRRCASCPSATFGTTTNQTACAPWTTCAPGTAVATQGTTTRDRTCAACPAGTYSAAANQLACTPAGACAAGTVETAPATATRPPTCATCEAGTFCAGNKSPKVACAPGTWDSDGSAATACVAWTSCTAGQFVSAAGSATVNRTCATCPPATFSTGANAGSCAAWRNCAAGTYVSVAGTSTSNRQCTACGASSFSSAANATSCTAWTTCTPGTYVSASGSATTNRTCTTCPAGQTSYTNNATACSVDLGRTIATGKDHTCAQLGDGAVRCWGANGAGQLGDGTTTRRTSPTPNGITIANTSQYGYGALAAGDQHTCAIVAAVDGAGAPTTGVVCWGDNTLGQLGNGSNAPRLSASAASPVITNLNGTRLTGVDQIAAGANHTCAWKWSSRQVHCWGSNTSFQLGSSAINPTIALALTNLPAGRNVYAITAGTAHTCAVTSSGFFCWGSNSRGALGVGSASSGSATPVEVTYQGASIPANSASAYGYHTCVAILSQHPLCWGENTAGQVGDGTNTDRFTPVRITIPVTPGYEPQFISTGGSHSCANAASGQVFCWGNNASGQFADGTNTSRAVPGASNASVSGGGDLVSGANHTCTRYNYSGDGRFGCWGANGSGQVGDGTTTNRNQSTTVPW